MDTKSKKSKHRFNIIDVLIIIGIVAVIMFCINMLTGDIFGEKIVNVHYTVRLDGVNTDKAAGLEAGRRIYSSETNIPAGIVTAVRIENTRFTEYIPELDRYAEKTEADLYTVYIDMTAGCVFRNGAYFTEAMRISENTKIEINIPFPYDNAEIIRVVPDEAQEVE